MKVNKSWASTEREKCLPMIIFICFFQERGSGNCRRIPFKELAGIQMFVLCSDPAVSNPCISCPLRLRLLDGTSDYVPFSSSAEEEEAEWRKWFFLFFSQKVRRWCGNGRSLPSVPVTRVSSCQAEIREHYVVLIDGQKATNRLFNPQNPLTHQRTHEVQNKIQTIDSLIIPKSYYPNLRFSLNECVLYIMIPLFGILITIEGSLMRSLRPWREILKLE